MWWGASGLEKSNPCQYGSRLVSNTCPLLGYRSNNDIPGRTLERRHLLHGAESAILPPGITVPVDDNDRQTGNQKESQGRSTVGAPVLVHGEDIIVPRKRRRKHVLKCKIGDLETARFLHWKPEISKP